MADDQADDDMELLASSSARSRSGVFPSRPLSKVGSYLRSLKKYKINIIMILHQTFISEFASWE